MAERRPVIKWPPGLLELAKDAAGPRGLSAYVVSCALGVLTAAEQTAVRRLADTLHDLAVQQVTLANRARVLALAGRHEEAEQAASDLRAFEKAAIQVPSGDLEQVSAAAAAAGFLGADAPQPLGNPNAKAKATQARSFAAFLRAATAAELEPRESGRPTMRAAEEELLAELERADG